MRAAFLAAAVLGVATGCTHRNDAAPNAAADGDAAGRAPLLWQRSLALPAGHSKRGFVIIAPDPAAHTFTVRVRHPAAAQLVVTMETPSGHLVFDSNIHPFVPSGAVDCQERRGRRTCVMRFPRLAGDRRGRWSVRFEKASERPANVRVEVAFSRVAAPAASLASSDEASHSKRRFVAHGITFAHPRGWFVVTEPLSPSPNPAYRFAVSSVPVRRTPADEGPCLPGIARQLPSDGVLVYLREALGADRRRSLPRMPERPSRFPSPPRRGGGPCGFERGGGYWYGFAESGRTFYLGVHVGPDASRAARRAVSELVDGMAIRAR
ncbi:MAG: hypothetical protein ICV64_06515 [Thermoleophilia bacterium]|nr:hypothetical protein [Thermoleophilia bacterium]